MSTVLVEKDLFTQIGLFNENLRCCEDYDLWLRASCQFPFLLVEHPLTIKEGGREDQVSYQYRVGMDRLRITAILDLLSGHRLSIGQVKLTLEELQRKCLVYGTGCLKHDKHSEGTPYLRVAEWANECLKAGLARPLNVPCNPASVV